MNNKIKNKDGTTLKLYHGTNRNFHSFDKNKSRTILNDNYQGDWLCFSPEESVAWSYADAARNQTIDKEAFLKESNEIFSVLPEDQKDLINTFTNFYLDLGDEDCYDAIYEYYSNKFKVTEQIEFNTFQEIKKIEDHLGFDINDYSRILDSVEYGKKNEEEDKMQDIFNFFNSQVQKLSESTIKKMKKIGFNDAIPVSKVFEVEVSANNILKTNDSEEAKKALENGYDLVIFNGDKLVNGVEEYLVANENQITIKSITRKQEIVEKLDDDHEYDTRSSYIYKKEIVSDNKNKNRIKIK